MNTLQKDINALLNDMAYEHPRYEIISDFFEMSAIAIRNAVSYDSQRDEYYKMVQQKGERIKDLQMRLDRAEEKIAEMVESRREFLDV